MPQSKPASNRYHQLARTWKRSACSSRYAEESRHPFRSSLRRALLKQLCGKISNGDSSCHGLWWKWATRRWFLLSNNCSPARMELRLLWEKMLAAFGVTLMLRLPRRLKLATDSGKIADLTCWLFVWLMPIWNRYQTDQGPTSPAVKAAA